MTQKIIPAQRKTCILDADPDTLPATRAVGPLNALDGAQGTSRTALAAHTTGTTAHTACAAPAPRPRRVRDANRNHVPSSAPRAVSRLNVPSRGLLGYQRIMRALTPSNISHPKAIGATAKHHRLHQQTQDRRECSHVFSGSICTLRPILFFFSPVPS